MSDEVGGDYSARPPSPRSLVAKELHETIVSFGIKADEPARRGDRKCWSFKAYPEGAQSVLEVFSDGYVRVTWAYLYGAPASRVFATAVEAAAFMHATFILKDADLARSIPTWKPKRG